MKCGSSFEPDPEVGQLLTEALCIGVKGSTEAIIVHINIKTAMPLF